MKFHLGQYVAGDSFLHKMDPRVKVVLTIFFMVLLFFFKTWSSFALYGAFLLVFWLASGIDVKRFLQSIRPILFLAILSFLLNALTYEGETIFQVSRLRITREGIDFGLKISLRLIYLVTTSSLFLSYTTSPLVIADALEDLMSPLKRFHFPAHELSLMISIALRFVPTIAEESENLMRAQSSRGANYDTGGIVQRVKGLLTILVPLFVSSVQRALDLANAMEARAYFGGEGRTRLREFKFQRRDALVLMASAFLSFGVILIERGIL